MSTVAVAVVPASAATPPDIAEAAALCGHDPVFVATAGVDEQTRAAHAPFGPLIECDPDDPGEAVAQLKHHNPVGITTFSEGMLRLTSALADGLGLPYHDHGTVTRLTNKWEQRRRLAAEGVDAVRSTLVETRDEALAALEALGGPAVVKPMIGQSSRDTYLVESPGRLPTDLTPTVDRPFVVEEYLRGRDEGELGNYVSVELLVVDGDPRTLGVTGKFPQLKPFRERAQFHPSHLPPEERADLARLASDAARALGVAGGLMHTEIKLTPDGPRIIEANGRIGGFIGELYRRVTGENIFALGIAVACGQPVELPAVVATDSVEFQYFNLQPVTGGVLRRVDGADLVRREPGVVDYFPKVSLGTELTPQVMTFMLDQLCGSVPDHDAMLATIDRCSAHLRFVIEEPGGVTRVWQATRDGLRALD